MCYGKSMRARTFHSAFAVVAVLAGIALLSDRDHPVPPQPDPTPAHHTAPARALERGPSEPVVYTTPPRGGKVPVELYARRVTRAVMVSTLPIGPLLDVALPYGEAPAEMSDSDQPAIGQEPQSAEAIDANP